MSQEMDYEKQYQADIERAQALSLESLALEKYRRQKKLDHLQSEINRVNSHSTVSTPVEASSSDFSVTSDRDRSHFISRPRPGSFNTGQSNALIAIAPPPASQRRNSASATSNLAPPTDDTDLISFTSPTQPADSRDSLKDLCEQLHKYTSRPIDLADFGEPKQSSSLADRIKGLYPTLNPNSMLVPQQPPVRPLQAPSYGFHPQITAGLNMNPAIGFSSVAPQIPPLPTSYIARADSPKLALPSVSSSGHIDVFKAIAKQDNSNLIDLCSSNSNTVVDNPTNVRVSVLEIFDPLLTDESTNNEAPAVITTPIVDDAASECSGSMYNEYDPFDYMYNSGSGAPSITDPIHAAVVRSDMAPLSPQSPPPLPPRAVWSTLEKKRKTISVHAKKKNRLYENIKLEKRKVRHHDCDLRAFYVMVKELRGRYSYNDIESNPGVVISPMISSQYREGTSIKLVVYPMSEFSNAILEPPKPISFTCDVSCSVEHVVLHVLCEMDTSPEEAHRLQVWGAIEYLAPETTLADYEYVHHCIKLEQDVIFSLVPERLVDCSLARTLHDDRRDSDLTIDDLVPNEPGFPISYDTLIILLETLEREMERVEVAWPELSSQSSQQNNPALYNGVIQGVKAVCALMGAVETPDITDAVNKFAAACGPNNDIYQRDTMHTEDGDFFLSRGGGDYQPCSLLDIIRSHCERIRAAVQSLVDMYCQAFRVDFQLNIRNEMPTTSVAVSEVLDSILVHVCALYRVPSSWNHADYLIGAQVYHGTRPVGSPVLSQPTSISTSFYPRILFNTWLDMEGMSVCQLAREARLVLVLYGRTLIPAEKDDATIAPKYSQEELGWAAIQFFDQNGTLTQGSMLISLWPPIADKRLGPAPCSGSQPLTHHPLLGVEIPSPIGQVVFPSTPPQSPNAREPIGEFASLDENTQQQLLDIVEMDIFSRPPVECREVLWEKRHYLHHLPEALPKVLLAAHSWDWACLADLHSMLHSWTPMQPVQALQLLLPCFPDMEVRRCAVNWVKHIGNDELSDYLPQLVQALKHETYEGSDLAQFLLERALASPRVAHHLYWLLTHSLPGDCPQNSQWEGVSHDEFTIGAARHYRRLKLMLRALLATSGESQRRRFLSQQLLIKNLHEVAENVQNSKESLRLKNLLTNLESVHQTLHDNPTCLPLSPSLYVNGIQVRTCSYFPSNTLPLKINFLAPSSTVIPAIVKVGDDLQQDMLTLQMVRIMDKLWLREGLDLKMVAFTCVPTGHRRGMIEMVGGAETLRKIQVEWGLTGSFKDKPIAEWLAKHNPSELEYERAVENFTASCAGYSVVTYILGICDRHNDNIMLKTSGHIFHIDFGKFLGDAQMFGNFKRDRTRFVLTSDMAYVINGGDRPSARFHKFVDLCCQAFNIVRKHGNLILHLFALMASSGIPGVTMDAVSYVRKSLLPGQSNPEAAAVFARLIESSLKSWFTQFNFFLHNLSQLRFTGDHGDGELLSFVPKTYSMILDGRLLGVQVLGYQKRYDPDKHYVYIIRVDRASQPDPSFVLRSYREFSELYQKICLHFPLAKVHSLPNGMHMGRSNIKQVAAKRKTDIELFLRSLFQTADEIGHSDLVYTFFHPLLRDQQPVDLNTPKLKDRRTDERDNMGRVKGELKLSVIYERGALSVMVLHARSLPLVAGGQEPSTYVKVYLQPDPSKATKRKTKVVRRSCHPTFMEMLEYRLPLDLIKQRVLQATIWNHDPLQENEFLGGVELRLGEMPLEREETHWFPLVNITR